MVLVNSADTALVTCTNTATFPAMIIGSNSASGFFVLLVNSALILAPALLQPLRVALFVG